MKVGDISWANWAAARIRQHQRYWLLRTCLRGRHTAIDHSAQRMWYVSQVFFTYEIYSQVKFFSNFSSELSVRPEWLASWPIQTVAVGLSQFLHSFNGQSDCTRRRSSQYASGRVTQGMLSTRPECGQHEQRRSDTVAVGLGERVNGN